MKLLVCASHPQMAPKFVNMFHELRMVTYQLKNPHLPQNALRIDGSRNILWRTCQANDEIVWHISPYLSAEAIKTVDD